MYGKWTEFRLELEGEWVLMYGLVLEGGGAKGAYQIGACKALKELGLEIKGVAGTSIGALNGAMVVQGDIDKAYDLWYDITPARVFNVNQEYLDILNNFELNQDSIRYILRRIRAILNNRGLDTTRIKKILDENIREEALRSSGMDFGFVTVSLSDFKPLELYLEDVPQGKIVNYLLASAYFPFFKLEKVDGKYLIDGGFYDNLPIRLLSSRGYQDIIAVRTFGMGRTRRITNEDLNITYIAPDEDLGRILDFNQERVRYNLRLGYFDALRVFKNLKGRKYYLESKDDKDFYLNFLINIGEKKILEIGKYLSLEGIPYRRMLFEYIIPRLTNLLDIEQNSTYEDIVIALMEKAAEKKEIKRFKVHSIEDFFQEITKHYQRDPQKGLTRNIPSGIPRFIRQYDLLSRAIKEEIITDILGIIFAGNNN